MATMAVYKQQRNDISDNRGVQKPVVLVYRGDKKVLGLFYHGRYIDDSNVSRRRVIKKIKKGRIYTRQAYFYKKQRGK